MCGICGELSFDRDHPVSADVVSRMTATLQHRGPDHHGAYLSPDGSAGLGFRRLSIIDLRPEAHQPMGNEDGSIQLVFNGEIYNFRELRRGLVARGHVFRSNADSEVILHLYEELGDRAIDELDGMFAFAIWDNRAQSLTLARDRAGKKPLYVWHDDRRVVFGSEIKALLAHPGLAIDVDPGAMPDYFLHGYVPHPRTMYRGVTHIEPATVAVWQRDGRRADRRYWNLSFASPGTDAAPTREEAAARVRELTTAAVERRLISDVPLGAFLSGGVDSTIIVGLMSRLRSEPVRTFSIGFEGDAAFDETAVARRTARLFGTDHTEFRVTPSAVDLVDTLVYHHDGPFADSSAIPTYLVSKLTREHVTVALTGDGGDEVFAGYLRFGAAIAAERVPRWVSGAGAHVLNLLPTPANERHWLARGRRFLRHAQLPLTDRTAAWAGVFQDDLASLLNLSAFEPSGDRDRRPSGMDEMGAESPLSQLLAANFHGYLHDDLLVKADRMAMANSLEGRAPFLDRALVEYVARLPDDYKLRGRTTKAVLREAFADLLPDEVHRGAKKGFGVPLDGWFRGELRACLHDTLLSPSAALTTFVSGDYVRTLVADHGSGRVNAGHKLWTLLTFERWLRLLPEWRRS